MLCYDRDHFEWQIDILCDTIFHKLKLPVGGNEADRTVMVEAAEIHTTMEGDIINSNTSTMLLLAAFFFLGPSTTYRSFQTYILAFPSDRFS